MTLKIIYLHGILYTKSIKWISFVLQYFIVSLFVVANTVCKVFVLGAFSVV